MNVDNKDYAKLHADVEWMKNIFRHIDRIVKKRVIDENDVKTIEWLVKQGLKVEKEE